MGLQRHGRAGARHPRLGGLRQGSPRLARPQPREGTRGASASPARLPGNLASLLRCAKPHEGWRVDDAHPGVAHGHRLGSSRPRGRAPVAGHAPGALRAPAARNPDGHRSAGQWSRGAPGLCPQGRDQRLPDLPREGHDRNHRAADLRGFPGAAQFRAPLHRRQRTVATDHPGGQSQGPGRGLYGPGPAGALGPVRAASRLPVGQRQGSRRTIGRGVGEGTRSGLPRAPHRAPAAGFPEIRRRTRPAFPAQHLPSALQRGGPLRSHARGLRPVRGHHGPALRRLGAASGALPAHL